MNSTNDSAGFKARHAAAFGQKLPVPVIVGATACGKTAVAVALAQRIGAEIISADSRQVYRQMDIGTAKPTPAERRAAAHHFVDMLPPQAEYSAGQFAREARARIEAIQQAGKNVIVAGGSGMYIRALLDGFFEPIARDKAYQKRLKRLAAQVGSETLYRELQEKDPERAAELHPNDVHRIVRALEVYHATGSKLSALRALPGRPAPFRFLMFGLHWPMQMLYARIEHRVDAMLAAGLEDEVAALLRQGLAPDANALQSVGYREVVAYLQGEWSRAQMVEKIKQHTRNFAKRQMTWFRRDARIVWLDAAEAAPAALAGEILARITSLQATNPGGTRE